MFNLFGDNTITEFIRAHSRAVIATVDEENQPSTSVIFYALDKHDELHFITKSQTKKFENLKLNNKAALTIVDTDKPIAVNISGVAVEVTEQATRDAIMQEVFKLSYGELHDYAPIIKLHKGSFSVLKFIPKQAKMTDYTQPMGKAKEDLKNY
jgi:general stress protein 26